MDPSNSNADAPTPTTLAVWLVRGGPQRVEVALDVIAAIATALAGQPLQTANLLRIHPETIEVEAVVGGLPRARLLDNADTPGPPYMAWPEYGWWWTGHTLDESEVGGEPAAVYCCGVVLWHLLAGAPLFAEPDLVRLAMRHLSTQPHPMPSSELPPAVRAVLERALARQRSDRFLTLEDFHRAVSAAQPMSAAACPVSSLSPPRFVLRSERTARAYVLNGSLEIRVGRSDPHTQHVADIDLGIEPSGRGVHRRQAILRGAPEGWTVEEWLDDARPRGDRGRPTGVNGAWLRPGDRLTLHPGDRVAFGPICMRFELLPHTEGKL